MDSKRLTYTIFLCLYIAAVAFLCFAKPDDMPQLSTLWFGLPADKVGHFLMFIPFPPLAFLTLCPEDLSIVRRMVLLGLVLALGAGLAIGTEHIQAQLAYRAAETKDFYADAAGLSLGGLCTAAYIFRKSR